MFHFTIRDLLWLMVVVALAVSWWIDNKRIQKTIVKIQSEQARLTQGLEDQLTILENWNKQHGNPPSGYVQALERTWGRGPPPGPTGVLVPGVSHPKERATLNHASTSTPAPAPTSPSHAPATP